MGIEIQQWRCRIGSFISRTSRKRKLNMFFTPNFQYIPIMLLIVILLLTLSGDIESNPGPRENNPTTCNSYGSKDQWKGKRPYKSHVREEDPWGSTPKTTKWRWKQKLKDISPATAISSDQTKTDDTSTCKESIASSSAGDDGDSNTEYSISQEWWYLDENTQETWFDADEQIHDTEMEMQDNFIIDDNKPIYEGASITTGQSALIILSIAFKHAITGELLSDILSCVSLHCLTRNPVHSSLYRFRKYFSELKSNLKLHSYCPKCDYLITQNEGSCPVCSLNLDDNTSYFVEIPVDEQIKELFKRKTFHHQILHRFDRKKKHNGNIEDIFDGELYRKQSMEKGFLNGRNNISLMWYTDGVPLFNSSKTSLWPVYLSINELPYKERVKPENLIFAGLWYGKSKPSMSTFLKPLHETMEKLKNEGVKVDCSHCSDNFISKALLLCGTCDLPAKCMILNMTQFNGKYGCPRCTQPGEVVPTGKGHTRVFPFDEDSIDGPLRSHDQFIAHGEQAFLTNTIVFGVKGPSWFTGISADAIQGTAIDYMHTVLLGLIRRLLTLWFDPKFSNEAFSVSKSVQIVEKRLMAIKPPHFVTRLPRNICDHSQYWKASECRSWLFYYSTPVLFGILEPVYFFHFLLLYEAIYLLSLDSISHENLQHSDELLIRFCCQFSALYGKNHMSANLHQLLHLKDVVKQLGPLWIYSCFGFESMNGKLLKMFHGTQSAVMQISNAVTSMMRLPKLSESMEQDLESPVGQFYQQLVNNRNRCHGKITGTISEGVFVIGGICRQNILEKYSNAILEYIGKPVSETFVFYRAMVHGCMYFSSHYKVLRRNSFTVKYKGYRNTELFGQIMFFAKCHSLCFCAGPCNCKQQQYVAVIRQILVDEENVMQEKRPSLVSAKLKYIFSGVLKDRYIAVPVTDILELCIYIDIGNESNRVFVTSRPNNKECD